MSAYINVSDRDGVPRYSDGKIRSYTKLRKMDKVIELCLHQWAAHASLVRRKGESIEECAIRRARSVPYHLSIFEGNIAVMAWKPALMPWASNGFNKSCISMGVGGKFPRLERNRTEAHSDISLFEEGIVIALQAVAEMFADRDVDHRLRIVTHRQSSASRVSDPGEAVARIAVREAQRLGLIIDFDRIVGSGSAAPAEWRVAA